MQITEIIATNVNGRDFNFPLAPITIITGKNRDGKTACLRTVRLGLLGYEPRLPKTNPGVFKCAGKSSRTMSVALVTDSGRIDRQWVQDASGSVAYTQSNTSQITIPPTLLDHTEFMRKTAAEQIKYVFDLINLAAFYNHDRFVGRLTDAEVSPPAVTLPMLDAMVAKAKSTWADCVKADKGVQFFLNKLEKDWQEDQKSQDMTAKASGQKIGALRTEVIPPDVAEKLVSLRDELTLVSGEIAQMAQRVSVFNKQSAKYEAAKAIVAAFKDESESVARLRADIVAMSAQRIDGESRLHIMKSEVSLRSQTLSELKSNHHMAVHGAQVLINQLDDITKASRCPTCHSEGSAWLSSAIGRLNADIAAVEKKSSDLDALLKSEGKLITELNAKIGAEQLALSKLAQANNESHAWLTRYDAALAKRNEAQSVVDTFVESNLVIEPGKMEELQSRKAFLDNGVETLTKADVERRAYVANKTTRLELEKVQLAAEAGVSVCKAFLKILNTERAKMIEVAFEKILEPANEFVQTVMPFKLEFKNGELGYESPEGWVGHETFSGAEEKVCYTGFCLALARTSKFRIAIIDEMSALDAEHKDRLIKHVRHLIENGRLEQYIGVDLRGEDYIGYTQDGTGLQLIALEQRKEVV